MIKNLTFKGINILLQLLNYPTNDKKCQLIDQRLKETGIIKVLLDIFLIYLWICSFFSKNQKINKNFILFKFIAGVSILIYESDTNIENINNVQEAYAFNEDEIFDAVVVGSGPGGAIASLQLTKKYSNVLLLESGKRYLKNSISHHSFAQTKFQFANEGMNFCYGNKPMLFAEGKTYGGGSTINSGLYFKLISHYRDTFLKLSNISNDEWSLNEQYVEKMLSIQKSPNLDKLNIKSSLINGSYKNGVIFDEVPRWRKYSPVEEHQDMDVTYLNKARNSGLKVHCEASVNKIIRKKDYLLIQFIDKNGINYIKSKKIVLSAGTVNTPKILKKSGLLKDKVRFNFQPMTRCVVDYGEFVNDGDLFPPFKAWTSDYKHQFGYGVSTYPYIKATLAALGYFKNDIQLSNLVCYYSSTILSHSQGKLFFFNNKSYPFIYLRKKDRQKITEGFEILKKILKSGGVKNIWPDSNYSPMTTVHIFGSMPLNINNDIGDDGELNIDNRIKISDASLLPSAPWGNPQAVIMVLNEILMSRWLKKFE